MYLPESEAHSDRMVLVVDTDETIGTTSADTIESNIPRDGQKSTCCLKWALVVLLALLLALVGLLYYFCHTPTSKLSAIYCCLYNF